MKLLRWIWKVLWASACAIAIALPFSLAFLVACPGCGGDTPAQAEELPPPPPPSSEAIFQDALCRGVDNMGTAESDARYACRLLQMLVAELHQARLDQRMMFFALCGEYLEGARR